MANFYKRPIKFPLTLWLQPNPDDPNFTQWQSGQEMDLNGFPVAVLKVIKQLKPNNITECKIVVDLIHIPFYNQFCIGQ